MRAPGTTESTSIPAPVKGWNTRDALDGMPEGYAIKLINMYPALGYVKSRKGSQIHCDLNSAEDIQTLEELPTVSGTSKLIAVCDGSIYDVTTSSPVALESGLLSSTFHCAVISNRLVMCNGVDTPRIYDGTSLAVGTYTGTNLVAKNLVQVCKYKTRLYFVEKSTANIWYGETAAITGELSKIDLSFVLHRGGRIAFVAPWSADTGSGLMDFLIVMSEEGEVLVFAGSDPASVDTWNLENRFFLPAPVAGRRGWQNIGSDLVVIHKGGVTALRSLLSGGDTKGYATISDAINSAFLEATASWGNTDGWDLQYHPTGQIIYVNIPVYGGAEQFVVNPISGSWARYVGMNATCWSPFEDDICYGSTLGRIYKASTGDTDDGAPIRQEIKLAYSYFDNRAQVKRFSAARPIIKSPPGFRFSMTMDCNYNTSEFGTVQIADNGAAKWGDSLWDAALWEAPKLTSEAWYSLTNFGRSGSLSMAIVTQSGGFEWYSTHVMYELGGYF